MEKNIIIETDRLFMRKMTYDDIPSLNKILQDEKTMYAYEHAFSDEEVMSWLEKQMKNYETYGFGLFGMILRETGEFIGQCGITMQDFIGKSVPEIGYLLNRDFWHNGYATEAALAMKKYAFEVLSLKEVYSIIRGYAAYGLFGKITRLNIISIFSSFKKYFKVPVYRELFFFF